MVTIVSDSCELDTKQGFSGLLEAWYAGVYRRLPWRETKDAYALWLSEIMLQQTQVATVLPYYAKFLALFPTIETLAIAPEQQVLKAWEGLGYYARARNLQKAAQQMMSLHGGVFPDTLDAVVALAGIGRSTAGAILTFAYGQKHPLLDGNVKRVISRLFDFEQDIAKASSQAQLWAWSEALLAPSTDAFTFNQAIMELGATVCTPKQPNCLLCPVRDLCSAQTNGTQAQRPVKAKKAPIPHKHIGVGVLKNRLGEYFVQQRPTEGLLANFWEFPGGKQEPNEPIEQTVVREWQEELGFTVQIVEHLLNVDHAYTHFKVTLHTFLCELVDADPDEDRPNPPLMTAAQAVQWATLSQLEQLPFPKANIDILRFLRTAEANLK
jgi:A/G-specific adenine glycosylase